jgi:membrane protein implicated in regulation of membrane protease activity
MLLAIAILLTVFVLEPAIGAAVIVLAAVVEIGEFVFWRRFLRRYRVSTGAEALIGDSAEVVEACEPEGRVRLRGELWKARAERPLRVGETVRVTAVDGLTLEVEGESD